MRKTHFDASLRRKTEDHINKPFIIITHPSACWRSPFI